MTVLADPGFRPIQVLENTPAVPAGRTLSPGRVAAGLSAVVAVLLAMHALVMYAKYVLGYGTLYGMVRMFDVLSEANAPSWYSSMTLFACAAVLAALAAVKVRDRDPFRWHWGCLAALFLFLSFDEAAMFHESVQQALRRAVEAGSAYYGLAAILFPATLALAVLVTLLGFLRSLPRETSLLFLTAGLLFVAGAIGVDYIGELHKNAHGMENLTFALMNGVEEALEMSAVVVFLYAALDYIRKHYTIRVVVTKHGKRSS